MLFFRKNKRQFGIRSHRNLFVALFLLVGFVTSFAICLFLKAQATSVPIPSVEIYSEHSSFANNEPGAWKITKSAEWTDLGKARVTFKVESIAHNRHGKLDVLMMIDNSGSMNGDKMAQVKIDATDLTDTLLSDSDNRMALVTFNATATTMSGFINDKTEMINMINDLDTGGTTNYNQAFIRALEVLDGYRKQDNRELVILFLTDGYPNEQTMNEVAQYQTIKTLYPYSIVNGIQYEMGEEILEPIIRVSDYQYIAKMYSLNNVLFEAAFAPRIYDDFVITDFIDNNYWLLSDANKDGEVNMMDFVQDVSATIGTIGEEITCNFLNDESDQIRWDLSGLLRSGQTAVLTIDLDLKEQYLGVLDEDLLFPTNTHETITSSLEDTLDENIDSSLTPKLKSVYGVSYDANEPSGCTIPDDMVPADSKHVVYSSVEISDTVLSCPGYTFKGWKLANDGVDMINEDYFRMPMEDAVVKAVWTKVGISKSVDGEIHLRAIATLDEGETVNVKLKRISGHGDPAWNTTNTTIVSIQKASSLPTITNFNGNNIISSSDSAVPIYAWYDNGIIYYYTDADEIFMNQDSSSLFRSLRALENIDGISDWNTSNVTNMSYMFSDTHHNVTDNFSLDFSGWDTSKVTNMSNMFNGVGNGARNFSLDLSGWDTSKVTDMSNMFYGVGYAATTWSINGLSGWDTSKVTNMSGMFVRAGYSMENFSLDVSGLDTESVTNMSNMFNRAGYMATTWSINGLSGWDTSKVTDMSGMFYQAGYNAENFSFDLSGLDTESVTDMYNMFYSAGYNSTTWSLSGLSGWDTSKVESMRYMFQYAGHETPIFSLDLSGWDTSSVTNMDSTFYGTGYKATTWSINGLSGWNTSSATTMFSMFETAGYSAPSFSLNLSGWNVSSVTNMSRMFYNTGYRASTSFSLDVSGWNPLSATDMSYMFYQTGSGSRTNFSWNLASWNTSNVKNMSYMFYGTAGSAPSFSLNLSGWITTNVKNMSYMFYNTGHAATSWSISGLSGWNTSSVTDMYGMFYDAGHSATSFTLDLSGWNTSSVTDMGSMFYNTGYLSGTWSINGLSGWNTSSVTDMSYMFDQAGYSATSFTLDLSGWNMTKVKNINSMFHNAGYKATTWSVGDLSGWNTSSVTNMYSLFSFAGFKATTWSVGDISGWDTSKVTNMGSAFFSVGFNATNFSLDLSGWDTSSVTNMNSIFQQVGYNAKNLSLNLSGWNTSNVTSMSGMFTNTGKLATTWLVRIPNTNGAGIQNTASALYGNSTSVYATPISGKSFTLVTP